MIFLKSEYDSVKERLKSKGLEYDEFSFVKKRGMLFIQWSRKEEPFCFYRKKETVINDQMQFQDTLKYYVGPKKELVFDSWEEVLEQFDRYLES